MISTDLAIFVKELLAFTLAYIPLTCFNGYFKAWLAARLGDDTAERYGYKTLNPMVHVDPIGLVMLVLIKIGFGRRVPTSLANFTPPFRQLKVALVLFANFISNFIALLFAVAVLVACNWAIQAGAGHDATIISISHIAQAMMILSVSLGVIGLIFGFFTYASTWWTPAEQFIEEHNDFIMVLLAMAVTLLAGDYIARFIFYIAFAVLAAAAQFAQWLLSLVR